MIQRIQSLFLLSTAIVSALLFFMPAAIVTIPNNFSYEFYTTKVLQMGNPPVFIAFNWMSMALNIVITALAFITILLFKKRLLQLRLCIVNIILQLGMLVLMWLQIQERVSELNAEWFIKTSFIFPVIGIILTWLALRRIVKDINLLKSFDRIR